MTMTAADAIRDAAIDLNAIAPDETLSDAEAADALRRMNRMMHAWSIEGVDVAHVDMALTDEFTIPAEHHKGLVALLAVEIAPMFQVAPSAVLVALAEGAKRALQAAYFQPTELKVDKGLQRMPSRFWGPTGAMGGNLR
jgi:hypothetical protein